MAAGKRMIAFRDINQGENEMSTLHKNGSDMPSRRGFLRAAAAGAVGFPMVVKAQTLGQNAPSNRITMGIIGCGNQAEEDLKQWLPMEDVQVVAVCDVNRASYGYKTPKQFLGREPVRDKVEQAYAQRAASGMFKGCAMYADFRELLVRKDIDTVAIITPDHWHAIQTIQAAAAGKDIYCQKPLGLTIQDGQEMVKAVRRHNRVLQTGSQWRSTAFLKRFHDAVRGGAVGKPRRVVTYIAKNNFEGPGPGWQPMPVPEGFDYDRWLGPAPEAPYHKDRCLYKFRFVSDYSGGQTTNFGHHAIGVAMWVLGLDETGPEEVWDMGAEWPPAGDLFDTATNVRFGCRYADGLELECVTSPKSFGVRVEGDKGWIETNGRKVEASSPEIARSVPGSGSSGDFFNHYRNFIECVKSRGTPVESVEIGHRVSAVCHLGNIAMKLSRRLRWDPKAERFVGDDEANKMLQSRHRAPWSFKA
jgi:predicted dehydrogenase